MENIKSINKKTFDVLSSKNITKAQCESSVTETQEFNVDCGQFTLYRTLFDKKLDITVYKDSKKGKVSINKFDDKSIENAIENCISVADSSQPDECYDIAAAQKPQVFKDGVYEPDMDKFFDRVRELMNDITTRHPKVMMEQMIVSHKKEHKYYTDTNNNEIEVFSGKYEIGLMYSAHEGEKSTSFFGSGLYTDNLDAPLINLGSLDSDMTDIENQLNMADFQNQKFDGTVVFTPSGAMSMLFILADKFAGDSAILKGTSPWKDKLGQKVADERISISFEPYNKDVVCGQRHTEDGLITEDFDLIKNGVLKNMYITQYVANKTGYKCAKNTSENLIIGAGTKSINDIIKNVKKGLLVARISGGEPSTNGDFSAVAKNSFLIENGKIAGAVTETMISGNLNDMVNNLVDISKETVKDGMMILPYVAFDKITISSK